MEAAGIKSIRSIAGPDTAPKGFSPSVPKTSGMAASAASPAVKSKLSDQKISSKALAKSSLANLIEVARQVGEKLKNSGVRIQFRVNRKAGRVVIVVRDPKTGAVVREIPPEDFMKSVEIIKRSNSQIKVQGLEVDRKL